MRKFDAAVLIFLGLSVLLTEAEVRVTRWKNPLCIGGGDAIVFKAPVNTSEDICVPYHDEHVSLSSSDSGFLVATTCDIGRNFLFNVSRDGNCTEIEAIFDAGKPNLCNPTDGELFFHHEASNSSISVSCTGEKPNFHPWIEIEICSAWKDFGQDSVEAQQSDSSNQNWRSEGTIESADPPGTEDCNCDNRLIRTKTWKDEKGCQRVWDTVDGMVAARVEYVLVPMKESCPTIVGAKYPIIFFWDENCTNQTGLSLEASAHACAVSGLDNVIMHCSINVGIAPADSPQSTDPPEEGLEPFSTTEPHGVTTPFLVEPTANTPLSGGAYIFASLGAIIISAICSSFSF